MEEEKKNHDASYERGQNKLIRDQNQLFERIDEDQEENEQSDSEDDKKLSGNQGVEPKIEQQEPVFEQDQEEEKKGAEQQNEKLIQIVDVNEDNEIQAP